MGYERLVRAGLACAVAALLCATPAALAQQDPLLDEFSHCSDWWQPRDQPGSTIVACDQARLDHFIASGLTDPGPGGAVIDGPEGRGGPDDVPATYSSEDPRGLRYVRITGSGSPTAVYAMAFDPVGVKRAATFAPTELPNGTPLRFTWNASTAALVAPDGNVVATAPVEIDHVSRFRMLPTPTGVHVHRSGSTVVVSWISRRGTFYNVSSGATPGTALWDVRVQTPRDRVAIRLPKGHHWIGVRAIRGSTFSRIVRVRVR